jgi:hypothetical protein
MQVILVLLSVTCFVLQYVALRNSSTAPGVNPNKILSNGNIFNDKKCPETFEHFLNNTL